MNPKALAVVLPLMLAACGGPKDGGSDFEVGNGTLDVLIGDAPVDGAAQVVVSFTGIELKPVGAQPFTVALDPPLAIELLVTADGNPEPLFEDLEVPAGPYESLRLLVAASPDTMDSFIELDDGRRFPLSIPADALPDLRIRTPFTVSAATGARSTQVIDIDLRRSLVNPAGTTDYFLRPVLTVIDPDRVGGMFGFVSMARASAEGCTMDLTTGAGGAVYVFEGVRTRADDVDADEVGAQPVASSRVRPSLDPNRKTDFEYRVSNLKAGVDGVPARYTAYFTCQALQDDPLTDDAIAFTGLPNNRAVDVFPNQSIQFDFVP